MISAMSGSRFTARPELPEHLDLTQADVYEQVVPSPDGGMRVELGGRMLVWTDDSGSSEIWWHRPDDQYAGSVFTLADLAEPLWTKITG